MVSDTDADPVPAPRTTVAPAPHAAATAAAPAPPAPTPLPPPSPSSRSLVSYFLQLIGGYRAVGRMGVTNGDTAHTEPTLPPGEAAPHASDAERARRGGRFGTTHGHRAA